MEKRTLLGKVLIVGRLECETGLHIGASRENMEIGAIDSPVVRDPVTSEPYLPGSSIKGKLRSLLEKAFAKIPNRSIKADVKIHVCDDAVAAQQCEVCRLFGSSGYGSGNNFPARLMVRDAYLTPESKQMLSEIDTGLQYTEWKFENAIDRVTSAANPRQLERVPRGAEFSFELVYNAEEGGQTSADLQNVRLAIELLKLDALGGHGSRGYGKVNVAVESIKGMTVEYLRDESLGKTAEVSELSDLAKLETLFSR